MVIKHLLNGMILQVPGPASYNKHVVIPAEVDSGMFMGAPRHTYLEKDPGYGIFRRHPKSAPPA